MNDTALNNNEKQNQTFGQKSRAILLCNLALLKLINSSFWKSPEKWFMTFVFTFFFIAIFGFINQAINTSNTGINDGLIFKAGLTGLPALMVISTGLNSIPVSIMEIKESVLMKRIGATPIRPWMFVTTVASFYFMITILQVLLSFFTFFIFFGFQTFVVDLKELNARVDVSGIQLLFTGFKVGDVNFQTNWGSYIFAMIYVLLLANFIAILITSVTKKSSSASMIGSMVFFFSMFLSGLLFPLSVISQNIGLNVLSFVSPFRYTNVLISLAWEGQSIFDLANLDLQPEVTGIGSIAEVWTGYFVPLFFIVLTIFISTKRFRWSTR